MSALYTALQTNFTGADAANGLLNPADHMGIASGKLTYRQCWSPKLIGFSNPGAAPATISIRLVNPVTLNEFEIDGGIVNAASSALYGGPQGFAEISCALDGTPWNLKCVSTGATAGCEFSVHFDIGDTVTLDPGSP